MRPKLPYVSPYTGDTVRTVKKTSIYLTDREIERLAWLAKREGIPQAEVIRKAIGAYSPTRPIDRDFRLARSGTGPGDSVADIPEEELLAGFGE